MSDTKSLFINTEEVFPVLNNPPIVEAVIDWQSKATISINPDKLKEKLIEQLPNYRFVQAQHEYQFQLDPIINPVETPNVAYQSRWSGFRLDDTSKKRVVQFTLDGVAFSNVDGYESWTNFHQEALKLWSIFQGITEASMIHRIGVRFINKILLNKGESASTYLANIPRNNLELPLTRNSFFYQDTYCTDDYPYEINLVRTISPEKSEQGFLIIDIDVFMLEVSDLDLSVLVKHLNEMRWLKNKIFFKSITEQAIQKFGG